MEAASRTKPRFEIAAIDRDASLHADEPMSSAQRCGIRCADGCSLVVDLDRHRVVGVADGDRGPARPACLITLVSASCTMR